MKQRRFYIKFTAIFVVMSILFSGMCSAVDVSVSAKSALLINPETGDILFEKNADEKVDPAGLATVMTALLAFEQSDLNAMVTVSSEDFVMGDIYVTAHLKAGETLALSDLIYFMMLPSPAEAANAAARHVGGSVEGFVGLMNAKAKELGCKNTNFTSPSGKNDSNQYTTARDMYIITKEALKNPKFMEFVHTSAKKIPATNLSAERTIFSNNHLISRYTFAKYYYSAAMGIKADNVTDSGSNLVSSAKKGSNQLLCFVFGAPKGQNGELTSYTETVRLYEWGFNNFEKKVILKKSEPITEVSVSLSKTNDYLILVPIDDLVKIVPKNLAIDKLERKFTVNDEIKAPIKAGDKLGTVSVLSEGKVIGTTDLVALTDVEKSEYLTLLDALVNTLNSFWFKLIISLVIILLFAYLYMLITARQNYKDTHIMQHSVKNRKSKRRRRRF